MKSGNFLLPEQLQLSMQEFQVTKTKTKTKTKNLLKLSENLWGYLKTALDN